jgi:hypothetical protein
MSTYGEFAIVSGSLSVDGEVDHEAGYPACWTS